MEQGYRKKDELLWTPHWQGLHLKFLKLLGSPSVPSLEMQESIGKW